MSITDSRTEERQPAPADRADGGLGAGALNLPNAITISRLLLSFVLFALISYGGQWIASAALFAFAAATDAVDGYLARRYGMVTTLGRILDPFVDKIIVCGTFVFLLAVGPTSGVGPWMVLIVIGREMFITGLRSILEQQGKDFSASLSGKIKMALQCLALVVSLVSLDGWVQSRLPVISTIRDVSLWAAVGFTFLSGIFYIRRAAQLLRAR